MSSTEISTQSQNTTAAATSSGFMNVATLEQALKCSEYIAKSSFCPKAFAGRAGDVLICLQMGQELGLKPMQALQNIAVINGRPTLWGDAMLAVCRQSAEFEYINEKYDEKIKGYTCIVKRRNEPEYVSTFTEADAKVAKLWGKEGPWTQYPKRMLQMRARGFCLRDSFPDLLRGIISHEEAEDSPYTTTDYSKVSTQTIEGEIVYKDLISQEQLHILRDKIISTGTKEEDICSYLKIEVLELMLASSYSKVLEKLEKKAARASNETPMDLSTGEFFVQADESEQGRTLADEIAGKI